jgi:hypothetical protein
MSQRTYPGGKTFAFSIFDDTDHGTLANNKPVYDCLNKHGIVTTKSVWVYPPRGTYTGQCLQDEDFRDFIIDLQRHGFEIALHNVGDGYFSRQEIHDGLNTFRDIIGKYPDIHVNHAKNTDNIYWGWRRFSLPVNLLFALYSKLRYPRRQISKSTGGSDPASTQFWGDLAKAHIQYFRNLTFYDINTLACDPRMPYRVHGKSAYSNRWFSSSDGFGLKETLELLSPGNLDKLERERGACIVYTHFAYGFVDEQGRLNPEFRRRIEDLASRPGYFAPVSDILNHLYSCNQTDRDPGAAYRLTREALWARQKLVRRLTGAGY